MIIHTALFREWHSGYAWFGRDSGLVTEGLRQIGVESRLVILDTPGMETDERFLPASRKDLLCPEFWASLGADAVVLQGGAETGIEPVSTAIRASRTLLLARLDSDGVIAPQADPFLAFKNLRWWLAYHGKHPATLRAAIPIGLKMLFPNKFGPGRIARRLAHADFFLIESRVAAARLRRILSDFGHAELASRVIHLPIPIPMEWTYRAGDAKEDLIVSVARWYDAQKDANKLVRTLARALTQHPYFRAVVIGDGEGHLRRLAGKLASPVSNRIEITGRLPHASIPAIERRAKIFVCPSRAESMNISSAEALCCGCSVVGPAEIAAMQEYTSAYNGTLAWTRRTNDFADALSAEIDEWKHGRRTPESISAQARVRFSPQAIAENLVSLVNHD